MSAPVDVLAVMDIHIAAMAAGRQQLPCSKLPDFDQARIQFQSARAAVAEMIAERDALRVVARDFDEALRERGMRCECGEADCRTTRLDACLTRFGGVA